MMPTKHTKETKVSEKKNPTLAGPRVRVFRGKKSSSGSFKNQGYEAARFSQNRGYVYFPTLDSTRDLDSFSLYELRRKSRWLYVNSGFATRCIDGIANMVGSLTPVPLTDDKEWNQLALRRFNDMAGNAGVWDAGGRFDFWRSQVMFTRLRLLDGDVSAVLTSTDQDVARVAFYEAHQIDNPKSAVAAGVSPAGSAAGTAASTGSRWCDGVLTSPQGRPIQYNIVTGDSYSADRTDTAIDSTDMIFHCEYRRPGRVRGEPALRHAINHLLDWNEIVAFTKTSIKNAAQIGYQITRNAPEFAAGPTLNPRGMGSGARNATTTLADGSTATIKIEDALKSGKIAEMQPGEEIKMLLDQRPHPNQMELLEHLARDASWGFNCSSDLLWNIAKLGGATVRYVFADAQEGVIEPGQELLADQYCSRAWIYFIAKEMKREALRKCQDPEWWKHAWQAQAKKTVDIGRDGKLYIDMHKSGMISLGRFFANQGMNWQVETDKYLDERKYIIEGVKARGMTMADAYPPEPGAVNATVQEDPAEQNQDPQKKTNKESRNAGKGDEVTTKEFLALMAAMKPAAGPTINMPPVNIPEIKIPQPNIHVTLPEQKAPQVHVYPKIQLESKAPHVDVHIPKNEIVIPAPQVTVNVPPAEVTVNNKIDLPSTQSAKVQRDKDGNMIGFTVAKE